MLVQSYGSQRSDKPLEPLPSESKRSAGQINESYGPMLKDDLKSRVVIDNATLAD